MFRGARTFTSVGETAVLHVAGEAGSIREIPSPRARFAGPGRGPPPARPGWRRLSAANAHSSSRRSSSCLIVAVVGAETFGDARAELRAVGPRRGAGPADARAGERVVPRREGGDLTRERAGGVPVEGRGRERARSTSSRDAYEWGRARTTGSSRRATTHRARGCESRLSEVPSVYADARVNGSSRRCFVEAEARANPEI